MVFDTVGKGQNITLAAPTTTLVKSGNCVLEKIVINKKTASGVITIYDDIAAVAANLKATITNPATLLDSAQVIEYNMSLQNGLTIVTSGAAQDITVVYR
jgi:hypothetical protein